MRQLHIFSLINNLNLIFLVSTLGKNKDDFYSYSVCNANNKKGVTDFCNSAELNSKCRSYA